MPQPPQQSAPKQPVQITSDFMQAAVRSRKSMEGRLIEDMVWALRHDPDAIAKPIGQLIPNLVGGVGSALAGAAQIGLNYIRAIPNALVGKDPITGFEPMSPIKVPGSPWEAPKDLTETGNQLVDLITLGGRTHADNYRKKLMQSAATRKDAQGNPITLEDKVWIDMQAGLHGLGEITGLNPLHRALSNTYETPVTGAERAQEGLFGALGVFGTMASLGMATRGKPPGAKIINRQVAELEAGAKEVRTFSDLATDLGMESGEDLLQAAKEGKSPREVVVERRAAEAQPLVEILQESVTPTAPAAGAPKPKLTTVDMAIQNFKSKIQSSSIQADGRILNAAGASMKMLDGSEMFVSKVDPASPLTQRFQATMMDEAIMGNPMIEQVRQQTLQSEVFEKILNLNPGMRDSHIIGAAIANGALEASFVTDLSKTLGLTPEVTTQMLANHYIHSATQAGSKLSIFNVGRESYAIFAQMRKYFGQRGTETLFDRIFKNSGGNQAADFLTDQQAINGLIEEGGLSISKAAIKRADKTLKGMESTAAGSFLQNVSKLGTKSMLAYVGTPARNFVNSVFAQGVATMEDAMLDTVRKIGGDFAGSAGAATPAAARRNALWNFAADGSRLIFENSELGQALSAAVDTIPTTSRYLRGSQSQIMGHLSELKATGVAPVDAAMNSYGNLLSVLNTLGELPMRKALWGSRMIKNLDSVAEFRAIAKTHPELADPIRRMEFIEQWGKDPKKLIDKYNITEGALETLDQEMRLAVSDAQIHTLKTQMSFQTPVVKEILDIYHRIPFADVVGPAFPKMLFNVYRYTMEHNPANLMAILDPEVRKMVLAGAEGGFKDATAARAYAKAISGAAMLATAIAIKSNTLENQNIKAGARPYEFQYGDNVVDTRTYSPFDKTFYLADLIYKTQMQGMSLVQALNEWTAAEVTDLALSQRRMGDIPVFALEKILQDAVSGDPERAEQRWKETAGEFMGRFFTPARNIKIFTDMIYPEDQTVRDQNNQAIVGPMLSRLPRVGPDKLPYRIDPVTGKPSPVTNPRIDPIIQILGVRIDKVPALTQELRRINYPLYKLIGNHGDERLDRAVAENVGKYLQEPTLTADKTTTKPLGEIIVDEILQEVAESYNVQKVEDPVLINSAKRQILDTYFGELRQQALFEAYGRPELQELAAKDQIMNFQDLTKEQKKALLDQLERAGILKQLRPNTNNKAAQGSNEGSPKQ